VALDLDGDNWEKPGDCDDWSWWINPDAEEVPGNDVDENCDGYDCDPFGDEVCGNGIDDNCDGRIDQLYCGSEELAPEGCTCIGDTPIIMDISGRGIRLTGPNEGVLFDWLGDGRLRRFAWTESGEEGGAFLALDLNSNSYVDDGTELVGSAMKFQGGEKVNNGFDVLRYLDTTEMNGNSDGAIDITDAAFYRLLLWVDRNHNGHSDPGELRPFAEVYQSIEYIYIESWKSDSFGNIFRWHGKAIFLDGKPKYAYDVILKTLSCCTAKR